jgi:hypothetical protein
MARGFSILLGVIVMAWFLTAFLILPVAGLLGW